MNDGHTSPNCRCCGCSFASMGLFLGSYADLLSLPLEGCFDHLFALELHVGMLLLPLSALQPCSLVLLGVSLSNSVSNMSLIVDLLDSMLTESQFHYELALLVERSLALPASSPCCGIWALSDCLYLVRLRSYDHGCSVCPRYVVDGAS